MSRHLKKSNEDYTVESMLLKQFVSRINLPCQRGFKKWLSYFKNALKDLEQENNDKKILNIIPVEAWIKNLEHVGEN